MTYSSYATNHVSSWNTTDHGDTAITWIETSTGDYMLEVVYQSRSRPRRQYVVNVN